MSAPFLPATYDLVWSGVLLASLGLAVWALLSLGGDRTVTPGARFLWVLLIVVAPVVGAAAWLLAGRAPRRATPRGREA